MPHRLQRPAIYTSPPWSVSLFPHLISSLYKIISLFDKIFSSIHRWLDEKASGKLAQIRAWCFLYPGLRLVLHRPNEQLAQSTTSAPHTLLLMQIVSFFPRPTAVGYLSQFCFSNLACLHVVSFWTLLLKGPRHSAASLPSNFNVFLVVTG
jgi:hypothetical protein